MPNRDFHEPVGGIAGGAFAFYEARNLPPGQIAVETFGGIVGGVVGAWGPDIIDPATTPNHRHIGHGVVNVAAVVYVTAPRLERLRHKLRQKADALRAARPYLQDVWSQLWSQIQEFFLRFLVGLLNGLAAGYISHLFFDALTPQGVNFFCRSC